MTKNKEEEVAIAKEIRFTFTAQFTEMDRIQTRINEQAFKLRLPCKFESIGGLKTKTCGISLQGPDAKLAKFKEWYENTIEDLIEPRGFFGLAINEYF